MYVFFPASANISPATIQSTYVCQLVLRTDPDAAEAMHSLSNQHALSLNLFPRLVQISIHILWQFPFFRQLLKHLCQVSYGIFRTVHIASMPSNCFRLRNQGRIFLANSMSFQTGRSPIRRFSFYSYSKFFSIKYSYPNTNVSSVTSPYRKSSKLVNED